MVSIGTFTLVFCSDHFWSKFPTYCALVPNTEKSQHHLDSFWDDTKPRDALQDHTEGVLTRNGSSRAGLLAPSHISCAGQFQAQDVTATGRWSERSPNCKFSARSCTNRLCRIRKQLPKQLGSYEQKEKKKGERKKEIRKKVKNPVSKRNEEFDSARKKSSTDLGLLPSANNRLVSNFITACVVHCLQVK